ncbi:Calycin [Cynara cardunculus var. scolymus]|uniref:Calycin n=1 Tax=Cynara cardunculus var. scolymus TaxID=59895 RepID=A0A103XQM3_CYNCS|nr:Calycin [Cynara cardunculus var. scolymus]
MNSIFILTLSTVLLVFQNNSGESINTSKGKYDFGFICTLCTSAVYALLLSLTQLSYRIVVKDESFRAVVAMIIYQSMVSSLVITIVLFASEDWRRLREEMMKFELGKVAYVMILVSNAPTSGINTRDTYTLNSDGTVNVLNKTWSDRKRGFIKGTAYKADPESDEAKLKVIIPVTGDYWVLYLDDDYQYALIGQPSRNSLLILSRQNHHDEKIHMNRGMKLWRVQSCSHTQ